MSAPPGLARTARQEGHIGAMGEGGEPGAALRHFGASAAVRLLNLDRRSPARQAPTATARARDPPEISRDLPELACHRPPLPCRRMRVGLGYDYTGRGNGEVGDFMWCTCTVIATEKVPKGPRSIYKEGEAVLVRWDADDRVEPPEVETESVRSS